MLREANSFNALLFFPREHYYRHVAEVHRCDLIGGIMNEIAFFHARERNIMTILRIILRLFILIGTLLLIAEYVPGISVVDWKSALNAAIILSAINLVVRPILMILTLPINLLTFGLFTFVTNASLFWLSTIFVSGFTVQGFLPAFIGALIITMVNSVTHKII